MNHAMTSNIVGSGISSSTPHSRRLGHYPCHCHGKTMVGHICCLRILQVPIFLIGMSPFAGELGYFCANKLVCYHGNLILNRLTRNSVSSVSKFVNDDYKFCSLCYMFCNVVQHDLWWYTYCSACLQHHTF